MKKILLTLMVGFCSVISAGNGKYKLDEKAMDNTFANAKETSFEEMYSTSLDAVSLQSVKLADGTKTRGGYLLRSFFCGGIALHRYYMGTTKKHMWAMYFCIPVVGGVTACVDFWSAVFDADAYKKYENNDKYIVWLK